MSDEDQEPTQQHHATNDFLMPTEAQQRLARLVAEMARRIDEFNHAEGTPYISHARLEVFMPEYGGLTQWHDLIDWPDERPPREDEAKA